MPASRKRRFSREHRRRRIDRAPAGREASQPARAATRAEIRAIRALVRVMAAGYPGQPVTVTFAEGSSPTLAVQVAVGLPQQKRPGNGGASDKE